MDKYSNKKLQHLTGLSARQLIYLAEKRIVLPEWEDADGRGSARSYSTRNVAQLLVVQALRDAGFDFSAMGVVAALIFGFFDELNQIQAQAEGRATPMLLNLADGRYGFLSTKDGKASSNVFEIGKDGRAKLASVKPEAVKTEAAVFTKVNLERVLAKVAALGKPRI